MSKRIFLQPAYVLHRRSYRETSFLVELFTQEFGRLTVIARGVRQTYSPTAGLLQPFFPLLVSLGGKGELMTLFSVEARQVVMRLRGEALFAGFYLNELLMYLLQKWDAHASLFMMYEKTLLGLKAGLEQKTLRVFEKFLFKELGYGVFPQSDICLQHTFSSDKYYRFIFEQGFVLGEITPILRVQSNLFSGKNLIAMMKEEWNEEVLRDAKRLTYLVLNALLGEKTLNSRELILDLRSE